MVLDTKGKLTSSNSSLNDMVQLWTWRSEFEVRGLEIGRVMDETS